MVVSDNPAIQKVYEESRAAGASHSIAMMCAFRKPPGAQTDREFLANRGTLADQFAGQEEVLKAYVANARKHGYEPNYTDVYIPCLAREEVGGGDPLAFVPASGGRSHVKKVCEQQGWACRGMVNVKASRKPRPFKPYVAEDIIERHVQMQIQQDPGLKSKKRQLREEFVAKHGPQGAT